MTEDLQNSKKNDITLKKSITIRGIDAETYKKFSKKIKRLNLNIGEAVTKMMNGVNDNIGQDITKSASLSLREDLKSILVSDQNKLVVTKNDLIEIDNSFNFLHIQDLQFTSDVDLETFMSKVIVIRACEKIKLPDFKISRLLLLSKFKYCDNIELYDI